MRKFLGRMSLRANRGRFFLQFFIFFSTTMVFIKTYFPFLSTITSAILTFFLGTIGTMLIGYIDEKKGFWRYELEHNVRINPFFSELDKKVNKIIEMIENDDRHRMR